MKIPQYLQHLHFYGDHVSNGEWYIGNNTKNGKENSNISNPTLFLGSS